VNSGDGKLNVHLDVRRKTEDGREANRGVDGGDETGEDQVDVETRRGCGTWLCVSKLA
jgi:hypothetical protein